MLFEKYPTITTIAILSLVLALAPTETAEAQSDIIPTCCDIEAMNQKTYIHKELIIEHASKSKPIRNMREVSGEEE